jgi:hypothetical protein
MGDQAVSLQRQAGQSEAQADAVERLKLLQDLFLAEQAFFWQRFYSFATLAAGAFVIATSSVFERSLFPVALAGTLLALIWAYAQWASLYYVDRTKGPYHERRVRAGLSFRSHWLFSNEWASSTNAALLVPIAVLGLWLWLLLRSVR